MKRAKVHLTNGDVAEVNLEFSNTEDWLDSVAIRGIHTEDSYFPHHSIAFILFEDVAEIVESNRARELEGEIN